MMIGKNYHWEQQVNLPDGIVSNDFKLDYFQIKLDYFLMPSDWKVSNYVGYFKVWQNVFFELQLERRNL